MPKGFYSDSTIAASGYWNERRTIRNFTPEAVDDDLLFNAIKKASKAPTTGGMQLYSVIVTKDSDNLKELAKLHFNQPAATGCRVMLTIAADFNRFAKWCEERGAEPGFDNFESFTASFLDATIFAQQLSTILEAEGLGVCYLGTTTYTASKIGRLLELPRLTVPAVTLAVGYPADNGAEAERLPTGALIHYEKYEDYTAERIEEIFAEKEELEANKKFVVDNGVPTLAHVFTDIRYPKANAELFSKDFYDYISEQGFKFPNQQTETA